MSRVIHITSEKQFNKLIKQKDTLIAVLYTTVECKSCREAEKVFSKKSEEFGDKALFLQVSDQFSLIGARTLRVLSRKFILIRIPVIQFFQNGLFLTEICVEEKSGCKALIKRLVNVLPILVKYSKTPKGYFYKMDRNGKKSRVSKDEYLSALDLK